MCRRNCGKGKRGIRERGIPGVLDRRVTGRRYWEWEVEELFEGKLGRTGWAVRKVQRGGGELIGGVWEMVGTGSVDWDEEGVRNEGRKRRIPEQ